MRVYPGWYSRVCTMVGRYIQGGIPFYIPGWYPLLHTRVYMPPTVLGCICPPTVLGCVPLFRPRVCTALPSSGVHPCCPSSGVHTCCPSSGVLQLLPSSGVLQLLPSSGVYCYCPSSGVYCYCPSSGVLTVLSVLGCVNSAVRLWENQCCPNLRLWKNQCCPNFRLSPVFEQKCVPFNTVLSRNTPSRRTVTGI